MRDKKAGVFWIILCALLLRTLWHMPQPPAGLGQTPGLQDFVSLRIETVALLLECLHAHPQYFASLRQNTQSIPSITKAVRASFYALKYLYPHARFPNVYFLIGCLTTAGTTSDRGLLMAIDMFDRTATMPTVELSPWHQTVLASMNDLPFVIAHELIHYQQAPRSAPISLLTQTLVEGEAEFVGELISGRVPHPALHAYGHMHEAALWHAFQQQMHDTRYADWLYNGGQVPDRPADLGYYVGYRIAESYYNRQSLSHTAIAGLLTTTDYHTLLSQSGYSPTE